MNCNRIKNIDLSISNKENIPENYKISSRSNCKNKDIKRKPLQVIFNSKISNIKFLR